MLLQAFLIFSVIFNMSSSKSPNFILFLTDDQDILLNGMKPMKNTIKKVGNVGKTFENAFVNSPICCPSRSTILTGKYQHNTGVKNNSLSGNCSSKYWQENHEPYTIAALLKKAGYNNFYAGKYLNQYGSKESGGTKHIPIGYNYWIGLKGNSKYYNYTLSINGTAVYFGKEYLTDVLSDHAIQFIDQNYFKKSPFFMTIATPSCHAPFTPARRHKNNFLNETVVRNPSFNATTENKHWLLQMKPEFLPENVEILDEIQKNRLQTLLSVDEMVDRVIKKLKKYNILDNTYIIFTSDNGYHIGQFGQPWDKRQPYQSDIRVPFLISGPNIPKKSLSKYPISSVDILPTILDLANVGIPKTLNVDGKSFKNILFQKNEERNFQKKIFIEYHGSAEKKSVSEECIEKNKWADPQNLSQCSLESWCKCQDSKNNTYTCVMDISNEKYIKYCRFNDQKDFKEVYDLKIDPYELTNMFPKIKKKIIEYYENILNNFIKCR